MHGTRLLILGGYGSTGQPLSQLLLQESDAHLVIAGRNARKARDAAVQLNDGLERERATWKQVDAADPASVRDAFDDVDMVIVASSTAAYTETVANAAIEKAIDYFDILYSTHKFSVLRELSAQIESAGLCFITDGGFHPGLPSALIRHLAPSFDKLESARVASVIKIDWRALDLSPSTMEEFVGEFMDYQALVYRGGAWQKTGAMSMMKPEYVDFTCDIGPNFGRQYAVPMFLEEMRSIPELYPEIRETGFLVGGFNAFVDWIISPIVMVALKVSPQRALAPMGRLFYWGLANFGKPPYGTLLKAELRGTSAGKAAGIDLFLFHEDGYAFTAIPAAASLLQYLDHSMRKPGLWLQGSLVNPHRLMDDMERLGIQVQYRQVNTTRVRAGPDQAAVR